MNTIIKRRVLISMLFIGLVMMGIFSQKYLPMELYPNADLPMLSVNIFSENELDPAYVESQAAIPVEGAVSALAGIEEMETRITPSGANITISLAQSVDLKYAFLELEQKIKSISNTLPDVFEVQVNKSGTSMASDMFMRLRVLGHEDIDYIRNVTDADIVPYLENISGIASVRALGGREKSIEVIVDPEKCEALNISNARISSLISQNLAERSFAGSVYEGNKRYFVNVTAEYLATEDLGNIVVAPGPIQLKDIAEIRFGVKEEESYSRTNGQETVSCILSKSPMENVIDLSERVREEIAELNANLASRGITIEELRRI